MNQQRPTNKTLYHVSAARNELCFSVSSPHPLSLSLFISPVAVHLNHDPWIPRLSSSLTRSVFTFIVSSLVRPNSTNAALPPPPPRSAFSPHLYRSVFAVSRSRLICAYSCVSRHSSNAPRRPDRQQRTFCLSSFKRRLPVDIQTPQNNACL